MEMKWLMQELIMTMTNDESPFVLRPNAKMMDYRIAGNFRG